MTGLIYKIFLFGMLMLCKITNELWNNLLNELKIPENQKKIHESLGPLLSFIWNYSYVYFLIIVVMLFMIIILLIILIYIQIVK